MALVLSVQHSQQSEDGYCLPACAQMALRYLGEARSQAAIANLLQLRKGFGVPASKIVNLRSRTVDVQYAANGTLETVVTRLNAGAPVIALVQAGELPHWRGVRTQHAVLLVGADDAEVHLHDPALAHGPITVPADDFLLAWQEMDCRYAVLYPQRA